jgi:hypothetical protein
VTASVAGNYLNTVPVNALQTSGGNSTVSSTAVIAVIATPNAIPTLSQWGLILVTALLALVGFLTLKK